MQRLCTKLRSLASVSSSHRLLHSSPQFYHRPLHFAAASTSFATISSLFSSVSTLPPCKRIFALVCLQLLQVRQVSSRERKKNRKPMTPLTSKVKKFKMKAYSSYKDRFRTMNDGTIRRWREGKNHNAHLKSKKSRRRLRQPSTVPAAYAKVMKKLSFCV
ncbi:hypothetical protein NC653_001482 [Populus alba x Populus x berolinensis]|uniref:50S ribosomal protein L35 n=1 Tax=Populus alba x Populus x berolinensis TaxID=444605 RepID=A0AAD6WFN6_9ROSI|nr:hypothetical protein NC653_001482 [Populus alba x Populus x berolinensis]